MGHEVRNFPPGDDTFHRLERDSFGHNVISKMNRPHLYLRNSRARLRARPFNERCKGDASRQPIGSIGHVRIRQKKKRVAS